MRQKMGLVPYIPLANLGSLALLAGCDATIQTPLATGRIVNARRVELLLRNFVLPKSAVKKHLLAVIDWPKTSRSLHATAATCCLSHKSRNALTEQISRESIYLPA